LDEYLIEGKDKTSKINKQTFIKQKLKIGVVLALSGKAEKSVHIPCQRNNNLRSRYKTKILNIEEKLRRFAKRVSGERRIRFPFVFLKVVLPLGRVLVGVAKRRRSYIQAHA
jgi:hypothetical protein